MKECCKLCTIHADQVKHEVDRATHSLGNNIAKQAVKEWSKAITGEDYYILKNGKHADRFCRTGEVSSRLSTKPSHIKYIETLYNNSHLLSRHSRRRY
jgi:hypothetical protein